MAKILVIEDNASLIIAYRTVFERHGHEVITASDGEDGLQKAESENPDVILLDMLMPKVHGVEFLEKYDLKNKHPNVKVIAFSNMDSSELIEQAMSLGATRYEVKSKYSPNQLANMVDNTLGIDPSNIV